MSILVSITLTVAVVVDVGADTIQLQASAISAHGKCSRPLGASGHATGMAEVVTGKVEDGSDGVVVLEVDQVSSAMLDAADQYSSVVLGVAIETLKDDSPSIDMLVISSV
jgi:hypothetical protein